MSKMKTNGQILYEYKYPRFAPVVSWDNRRFAIRDDIVMMPIDHVPWNLLTEECRQSWEQTAEGHWLFSTRRRQANEQDE